MFTAVFSILKKKLLHCKIHINIYIYFFFFFAVYIYRSVGTQAHRGLKCQFTNSCWTVNWLNPAQYVNKVPAQITEAVSQFRVCILRRLYTLACVFPSYISNF